MRIIKTDDENAVGSLLDRVRRLEEENARLERDLEIVMDQRDESRRELETRP
jgi:uncharacterized protein (UPF0335 family)